MAASIFIHGDIRLVSFKDNTFWMPVIITGVSPENRIVIVFKYVIVSIAMVYHGYIQGFRFFYHASLYGSDHLQPFFRSRNPLAEMLRFGTGSWIVIEPMFLIVYHSRPSLWYIL